MNGNRFKLIVAGSLLGLVSSGLALGGDSHAKRGHGKGFGGFGAHLFDRVDADKDGRLTRTEAQTAADSLFARLDANADGVVNREEARAGLRALAQEEIEARFKAQDADGDGRVTLDESKLPARFFQKLDRNSDQALTPDELDFGDRLDPSGFVLRKADADRDGQVTRAEAAQAALSRFDRADANRDGVLTRGELETRRGKRGKGRSHRGARQGRTQG